MLEEMLVAVLLVTEAEATSPIITNPPVPPNSLRLISHPNTPTSPFLRNTKTMATADMISTSVVKVPLALIATLALIMDITNPLINPSDKASSIPPPTWAMVMMVNTKATALVAPHPPIPTTLP
jgi:hypothetical protein